MPYAFVFDATACSGCKACQVACKDKNNLPLGVLWRRVYEVSGGSWQQHGQAWVTDVFAYNLSIACNHCEHPKCAGVCPTDAYVVRPDGIVYIDESKCIGCGYCNWACPYAAPQYNPERGTMAKCNFCFDHIEAGLPPACVAACPMRVLDYVAIPSNSSSCGRGELELWQMPATEHPFPLPKQSRTEPHLAIKPHAGMLNPLNKTVFNREEIQPAAVKSELPLVIFTLVGQMTAGMALFSLFSGPLSDAFLYTIGALIGVGALASLLHLGKPLYAWRTIAHLKKSSLSREILMFGFFAASWLGALAIPGMGKMPLALCGIGLVYSMAQVYRLRSIPAWDTARTLIAFIVSAVSLGSLGLNVVTSFTNSPSRFPYLIFVASVGLVSAFAMSISEPRIYHQKVRRLRYVLILGALLGMLYPLIAPDPVGRWITVSMFVTVLIEEGLGRWLFYEQLHQRIL